LESKSYLDEYRHISENFLINIKATCRAVGYGPGAMETMPEFDTTRAVAGEIEDWCASSVGQCEQHTVCVAKRLCKQNRGGGGINSS